MPRHDFLSKDGTQGTHEVIEGPGFSTQRLLLLTSMKTTSEAGRSRIGLGIHDNCCINTGKKLRNECLLMCPEDSCIMDEGPEIWWGVRKSLFGSNISCLISCDFTDIIKRKWALLVALNLFKVNDPYPDLQGGLERCRSPLYSLR